MKFLTERKNSSGKSWISPREETIPKGSDSYSNSSSLNEIFSLRAGIWLSSTNSAEKEAFLVNSDRSEIICCWPSSLCASSKTFLTSLQNCLTVNSKSFSSSSFLAKSWVSGGFIAASSLVSCFSLPLQPFGNLSRQEV